MIASILIEICNKTPIHFEILTFIYQYLFRQTKVSKKVKLTVKMNRFEFCAPYIILERTSIQIIHNY